MTDAQLPAEQAKQAAEQSPLPHPEDTDKDWLEICETLYSWTGENNQAMTRAFAAILQGNYGYRPNSSEIEGFVRQAIESRDQSNTETGKQGNPNEIGGDADPTIPGNGDDNTITFTQGDEE